MARLMFRKSTLISLTTANVSANNKYRDIFGLILPTDAKARRLFVTSGGLKKVQEIHAEPGTTLSEYITIINCCFPEEIVRYYSPGYPDSLLEAVEQYKPKCLFVFDHTPSSDHLDSNLSHYNNEDH